MSESEYDALVGRLIREEREAEKELGGLVHQINSLAGSLAALANGLRVGDRGGMTSAADASRALNQLPDNFSRQFLRGLIVEHSRLAGRLQDLRAQLAEHGVRRETR